VPLDGAAQSEASRVLYGLLYAKRGQLPEAKCFRAGVELSRIATACTSTIDIVKCASRPGLSVHAAAAVLIARRGRRLTELLPRVWLSVSRCEVVNTHYL